MSFYEKSVDVFLNWDKNIFRNLLHDDFLFLREFELVTVDDYVEMMHRFMLEKGSADIMAARINQSLIHENEDVTELRWEDNGEIVTNLFLKKEGLAWRSMVKRVTVKRAS